MKVKSADREPLPAPPPRPIVRAVLAMYGILNYAAERLVPPEVVMMMRIGGFWNTQVIHVAARLGLADHLEAGPKTSAELASITGANPDALHRTMRALCSIGVFHVDREGRFANNRLSRTLRSGIFMSMRDLADYFGSPSNLQAWADFERTVMSGDTAFPRVHGMSVWKWLAAHPDESRAFAGSMTSFTEQAAPAIVASYPFAQHSRICDVAGGRGTLLAEVLVQNRSARGVLFDEAHVLETASPYLSSRGVLDRVDRVAGSFFEKIPEGCDAYILKDILHDWDDTRALAILESCRRAMKKETRLLVTEILLGPHDTEMPGPLIDIQMLAVCDGGRQRSEAELTALFAKAGLELRRVHPTPMPVSIVEATIR
jgi:hypothetical protein